MKMFLLGFLACYVIRPDIMVYLKGVDVKRLFGEIYFCYDKKAKNWMNKIFLFRYKSSE